MDTSWRDRLEPWPVAAFCAVTLFIWGNRIWLAWTNPDDSVATKIMWSTPITLFVVAAVILGVLMLSGVDRSTPAFGQGVAVFALGTVVYWAVRAPMITFADHEVAFKVVHGVLAVVSVAAAVGAWSSVRNRPQRSVPEDGSTIGGRRAGDSSTRSTSMRGSSA